MEDRIEALFRPPLGEMMALSPDGQRVAYTLRENGQLRIVMMDLDFAGPKRTVNPEPERGAAAPPDRAASPLRFMRWATEGRLVFAPAERIVPLPPVTDSNGRVVPNPDGPTIVSPILVADGDGKLRGTLIDASYFQETPTDARRSLGDLLRTTKELQATRSEAIRWRMPHLDILGFLPAEREQLVIATRGAYSMPMQHLVDTRTGSVREFGGNWPTPPGDPQVFDWHSLKVVGERKAAAHPATIWRDDELAGVQRELETKFSRRIVEILDWSETRSRVLCQVTGGSDAGRFFVYQRPEDLVMEIVRCAPWLEAAQLHETGFFEFTAPDGAALSGYVTWPHAPRATPPPLLVVFPTGFPGHAQPAFDPEAQAFADLGFAVARLNHRSVAGVRREDLNALRTAIDRVSVNDARTAIEALATRHPQRPFDRDRIAALGRGFGGYLALRALQLHPNVFRSGIAIDAPIELRPPEIAGMALPAPTAHPIPAGLIDHADTDWKALSVLEQVDALIPPALLLAGPSHTSAHATDALRARLQALGRVSGYVELEPGFAAGEPKARAAAYQAIDEFLAFHLQLPTATAR